MDGIRLEQVCKSFGDKQVLQDFSAEFPYGSVTTIMAPSGSGKTTLLRILMGLETIDKGQISGLDGRKRSAVFQEDRLCKNLDAAANIRLVCPQRTWEEVEQSMEAVGLTCCSSQPVRELSGGMRRRVAILRALLAEYDLLFLDEPFKGLDVATKEKVLEDTKARCIGKTVILVTHNREEAEAMGTARFVELGSSGL